MGDTPVCTIDETGIHLPDFQTVQNYFLNKYRGIYGDDVYLGNDSQDGQFLGILAAAINDANMMAVAVYNAYSPATAQGTGLSSNVKINGIARKVPTRSVVDIISGGQAGTSVVGGIVADNQGFEWVVPDHVIPNTGQILVTATAALLGAIEANIGSVNKIVNPQIGWQTVINPTVAIPGDPIETDASLRKRQALSTELPSRGLLEGLVGSLWALSGVTQVAVYENTLWAPDANGIPGHSYAVVIDGGDVDEIADTIMVKKGGGVGTYGDIVLTRTNAWDIPHQIAFWRPTRVPITWVVTLDTLPHYTTNTEMKIAQALSDWTNTLGFGAKIRLKRAYLPVNLNGSVDANTYEPLNLEVARDGNVATDADISMAFNEEPVCLPSYVQFRYPDAD